MESAPQELVMLHTIVLEQQRQLEVEEVVKPSRGRSSRNWCCSTIKSCSSSSSSSKMGKLRKGVKSKLQLQE